MNWKGLLVPIVSVTTFLGCLAFILLIKISVKSFRKKVLFSLTLIQTSIAAVIYLVAQFVLVVLHFLDMWIVSWEPKFLGIAYMKYLPRFYLLILPILLQIEMFISVRKERLHSKINSIRFGVVSTIVLSVALALLTFFLVFGGILKTYFFPSEAIFCTDILSPLLELIIAICGLSTAIYLALLSLSSKPYAERREAKQLCVILVSRFCAIIFSCFIFVNILRLCLAQGHTLMTQTGRNVVECIALVIDICLLSFSPLVLLRKTKAFKELHISGPMKSVCVNPNATVINSGSVTRGTLLPRDQDKDGMHLMPLKGMIPTRQNVPIFFNESAHSKPRVVDGKRTKPRVRRFSFSSSVESFKLSTDVKNLRRFSMSSVYDTDSLSSRFSNTRILPQFQGIPEDGLQGCVEDVKATDTFVQPKWTSVRIPGMVRSSVPSSPISIQMQSFASADWDKSFGKNSAIVTPSKGFDQTKPVPAHFVFPSITRDTCWLDIVDQRFSQEGKTCSLIKSDSMNTASSATQCDVSPELRLDYVHVAQGQTQSNVVYNLPGSIPSPGPFSSRKMSRNDSCVFVFGESRYSVQENVVIAMLFDT